MMDWLIDLVARVSLIPYRIHLAREVRRARRRAGR